MKPKDQNRGDHEGEHVIMAPCKVNWFLEIERRRLDGYHQVTTEMETIDWCDRIAAVARDDGALTLHVTGDERLVGAIGAESDNLVLRAAHVLRDALVATGESMEMPGASLWLDKRVPAGAGLGGGSSDSVATMRLLCRLWGVTLAEERLSGLAAMLGSDTAFFVHGGRAVCRGRGEQVTPLPKLPPRHLVVVWPGFPVSTPMVYRSGEIDLKSDRRPWRDDARTPAGMFNRLEAACALVEPRVREALARALAVATAEAGTRGESPRVMLSGSGSGMVVTAESADEADGIAGAMRAAFPSPAIVRACRTTS